MTERFHKGDWSNNICEVYDNEDYIGGVQLNCADEFINLLNSLNEENKQLKQFIMDLQNMIQFDVDNGIKTYPIKLSEYLANVLKEICND